MKVYLYTDKGWWYARITETYGCSSSDRATNISACVPSGNVIEAVRSKYPPGTEIRAAKKKEKIRRGESPDVCPD